MRTPDQIADKMDRLWPVLQHKLEPEPHSFQQGYVCAIADVADLIRKYDT